MSPAITSTTMMIVRVASISWRLSGQLTFLQLDLHFAQERPACGRTLRERSAATSRDVPRQWPRLLRFLMELVTVAARAILLPLDALRMEALVLVGEVIAILAVAAGKNDFFARHVQ